MMKTVVIGSGPSAREIVKNFLKFEGLFHKGNELLVVTAESEPFVDRVHLLDGLAPRAGAETADPDPDVGSPATRLRRQRACAQPLKREGRNPLDHAPARISRQVQILTSARVTRVDTASRRIQVEAGARAGEPLSEGHAGLQWLGYDELVIASGSISRSLEGWGAHSVLTRTPRLTVRSADDVRRLCSLLHAHVPSEQSLAGLDDEIGDTTIPSRAGAFVVVGAGAIGLEVAELLALNGAPVHVFDRAVVIGGGHLSEAQERVIFEKLRELGVIFHLGLTHVLDEVAHLAHGLGHLRAIVECVGISPATAFLDGSGVELTADGHVRADDHMRTTAVHVSVVGEVGSYAGLTFGTASPSVATATALSRRLFGPQDGQGFAIESEALQSCAFVPKMRSLSESLSQRGQGAVICGSGTTLCHCRNVTTVDIDRAVLGGRKTFDEIQHETQCSTGCGSCATRVKDYLAQEHQLDEWGAEQESLRSKALLRSVIPAAVLTAVAVFVGGPYAATFFLLVFMTSLRYFTFPGGAYLMFFKLFPEYFSDRKLQRGLDASDHRPLEDLVNSVRSIFVFASLGAAAREVFSALGILSFYDDVNTYGWAWFVLSIPVMLLIHDTYFYWMHRMVHFPLWYAFAHREHHLSTNPTPLTAYSFNWAETLLEYVPFLLMMVVLPVHPTAFVIFLWISNLYNAYSHLGHEIMPLWLRKSWVFQVIVSSAHHNAHHKFFNHNYSFYFRHWDRWCGTEHPAYQAQLTAVVPRV